MEYPEEENEYVEIMNMKNNIGVEEAGVQNTGYGIKIEKNDYVNYKLMKSENVTFKPEFDIKLEYEPNEDDNYVDIKEEVDVNSLKYEHIKMKSEVEDSFKDM